jgi:hypothetical protein
VLRDEAGSHKRGNSGAGFHQASGCSPHDGFMTIGLAKSGTPWPDGVAWPRGPVEQIMVLTAAYTVQPAVTDRDEGGKRLLGRNALLLGRKELTLPMSIVDPKEGSWSECRRRHVWILAVG